MQILSTVKETKATLQKKRNLFGLGFTSLIAACSTDGAAGTGGGKTSDNGIATYKPTVSLPDEIVKAEDLAGTEEGKSGFTATLDGDMDKFTVAITDDTTTFATLAFSDGIKAATNAAKIYTLTPTTDSQPDTKYDLVVSSSTIGNNKNGGIFIFWDVAGIEDETIGGTSTTTLNQRLEIKGAAAFDFIGLFAPELLQIGGTKDNYDMVFVGRGVDRLSGVNTEEGAIYVLWDVADYKGATKTIDLGKLDNTDVGDVLGLGATAGSLTIYGAISSDKIGTYAPQLLELGSADDAYDMVIRSNEVNKTAASEDRGYNKEGAIYVLWDVTGYHDTEALHKTVTLDNSLVDASGAYTNGATYGLLAIYGRKSEDQIGTHAPEFLQLGGVAGDKLDMVIRSRNVDKPDDSDSFDFENNEGAIYILWDVADYAGKNKTIDLGKLDDADVDDVLGLGATAGSLAIYGAIREDQIGTNAPEFLQIAGKDGVDMVIGSKYVNSPGDTNAGAIYILWDVADYYSAGTDKNKSIDLDPANLADATSGLLTIYGRDGAKLGEKYSATNTNNNILYNTAADGIKSLTNIDGDAAGTKDIALTDGKYAYIFFGDKIADKGEDEKVDSKTIDLGVIETGLGDGTAGFFEYDFTAGSATRVGIKTEDAIGYRYADDTHKTLAAIDGDLPSFSLSDADSDLGVWDIA